MDLKVPESLTDDIIRFCKELNSATAPLFIRSSPSHHLEHYESFSYAESHVEIYGGEVETGWLILEWESYLLAAGSHAVWKHPNGQLIDIALGLKTSNVLFLPDSTTRHNIERAVRKNLQDNIIVEYICALTDLKLEFSHDENAETDITLQLATREHSASPLTIEKLFPIESNLDLLYVMLQNKKTRNSRCPCCSGSKFKHCHEKDIKKLLSFSSSAKKWVVL